MATNTNTAWKVGDVAWKVGDVWDVTPTWWTTAQEEGDSARIGEAILRLLALENSLSHGLALKSLHHEAIYLGRDLADHDPTEEQIEDIAKAIESIPPRNEDPERSTLEG